MDKQKNPSGGRKIIFQFSEYINSLKDFNSSIVFVEKKKIYKIKQSISKKLGIKNNYYGWKFNELSIVKHPQIFWSNHKINFRNNFNFNKKNDFVILPEIFAHFANDFLINKNISYAIFVQNGYAIFSSSNLKEIKNAYKKAKFILSYSKDIDECMLTVFPECKSKLLRVVPALENEILNKKKIKKNLITFMPRKLHKHSQLVLLFLKNYLPKNWKIKAIENLNENQVFEILSKSKIFLSFSELEGLGMPPIEAALAGNKVIGYTGEAGKEYWKKPIFTEVKNGEIMQFCKIIIKNLNIKNFEKKTISQRLRLLNQYSIKKQKLSLLNFLKKINNK